MTNQFPKDVIAAGQKASRAYPRVPVSVSLAQWALESAYGHAEPKDSDNPFGIKALPGQPSVIAMTHETLHGKYIELPQHFRKFASIDEAFMAHAKLLATAPVYHKAQAAKTADEFAMALQGVYATGIPGHPYGVALIKIMRVADLYKLDKLPPIAAPVAIPKPAPVTEEEHMGVLKHLLATLVESLLQTLHEDQPDVARTLAASGSPTTRIEPLLGVEPMNDTMTALASAIAEPSPPAAPLPDPTSKVPTVSTPATLRWGHIGAQILDHMKPILEAAAPEVAEALIHKLPMGAFLSAFVGPKVVDEYVDQVVSMVEGSMDGRKLTVANANMVEKLVFNTVNNSDAAVAKYMDADLVPMIKARVAAYLPPTA